MYILFLLLPVILVCSIRNLKYLSPFSILANILEFVGLGIIFYFIFAEPLPPVNSVPYFASAERFPIFFGTAIFAFEGISVVLPIENQMRKPKVRADVSVHGKICSSWQDMLGWAGVLNFSMVTIALLYIAMGSFGYLRYGNDTKSSITLNLPQESPLAEISLGMFSLAIFFSYALQFYVVMDIIGPNILKPACSEGVYPFAEFFSRVLINVLTRKFGVLRCRLNSDIAAVGLAATVPWLELLVSLLGAIKMSTLSLMAPALIDSAAHWNSDTKGVFIYRSIKNTLIFIVGFLACVVGAYISTVAIINKFKEGY